MYTARKSLCWTHHSRTRPGGPKGGKLNALFRTEIRLVKLQMVDRGGKRRGGECSCTEVIDRPGGISRWPQIQQCGGCMFLAGERTTGHRSGSRRIGCEERKPFAAERRRSDGGRQQPKAAQPTCCHTYQSVSGFLIHDLLKHKRVSLSARYRT
jgi:hypothetical protein